MNPFKLPLLLLFAPRFLADMPPKGPGRFIASAEKYSRFFCHSSRERTVFGRRRAYVAARWLALVLDWGRHSDAVGVRWAVYRLSS